MVMSRGSILHRVFMKNLSFKEIFEQRFEGNKHANTRRKSRANSIKVAEMRLIGKSK